MAEAKIIDGAAVAAQLRERVATAAMELRTRHGIVPGLATVIAGDDPASHIYVRSKARACQAAGLASFEHRLPADAEENDLIKLVERLNADE
jgi:methylenetetrahydrofolate dehydrogenase (NADP+)/methenyltetrahydrofolate cyclohydrolase